MFYNIKYQEHIKKITDTFINKQFDNIPSYDIKGNEINFHYTVDENFNISYIYDTAPDVGEEDIIPHHAVIFAWRKIQSEYALKWLNKNMLSYDDWFKNFYK